MPRGSLPRTAEEVRAIIAARSVLTDTGCWQWLGSIYATGYAQMIWKPLGRNNIWGAHRVSYEAHVGMIPEGLQLDHLCRNRSCVNPGHLEPVSGRVNTLRSPYSVSSLNAAKDSCVNGHPFDDVNTYWHQRSSRAYPERGCKECRRVQLRESRERRAAAK